MIAIVLLLIFVPASTIIALMQLNHAKLKKEHSEKMTFLQSKATHLLKNQNELHNRVAALNSFDIYYNNSQKKIANAVLDLQYELFAKVTQKKI